MQDEANELRIRPHAEEFLNEMSQYYEIVVFTAAMQDVRKLLIIKE